MRELFPENPETPKPKESLRSTPYLGALPPKTPKRGLCTLHPQLGATPPNIVYNSMNYYI